MKMLLLRQWLNRHHWLGVIYLWIFVWLIILIGITAVTLILTAPKCDICGAPWGRQNQHEDYWICDDCESRTQLMTAEKLGFPTLEKDGYTKRTKDFRKVQLRIIKEMMNK